MDLSERIDWNPITQEGDRILNSSSILDRAYRHVYLVQNRGYWQTCPFPYDKELDLVLSFDFGVVNQIIDQGGTADYLDHLVASQVMERYNHETYDFFEVAS